MALLILIRHGESEGNVSQILTGQTDVALTARGRQQARQVAENLKDIVIHKAYVSELKRSKQTLAEIQERLAVLDIPVSVHTALNERDFGALTSRSKRDVQKELGEAAYTVMLRGWDTPAPAGESLQMVYGRVVSYFQALIYPELKGATNVIVVSHHQTLRALVKYLDAIPDDKIALLKIRNGEAIIYQADGQGNFERLPTKRPTS
jgi:2,3-bisphosphoglycerate-dependent phosphoglycerate mutase